MIKRVLAVCLVVTAVLLGALLVSALGSTARVQVVRSHLVRYLQQLNAKPVSPEELGVTTPIVPMDVVWEMLGQVDKDRALEDLRQLTGEEPLCISTGCYAITHRLTGSEDLRWAMDYLYENLGALGYTVEFLDWSRSGYTDRNLIATKTGVLTPTEHVYLVAHVDGVKGSDDPYPAADDNASGVVNGLELARIFSNRQFGRTIVLFFSTGEEQSGSLGVEDYLDGLSPSELSAIKYVINRDMVGYDANGDSVMNVAHGDHPPTVALAQIMSEIIDAYQLDLDQQLVAGCP